MVGFLFVVAQTYFQNTLIANFELISMRPEVESDVISSVKGMGLEAYMQAKFHDSTLTALHNALLLWTDKQTDTITAATDETLRNRKHTQCECRPRHQIQN